MRRTIFLVYGVMAHLLFLAVYLYLIGFVSDLAVPKSLDRPMADGAVPAILMNLTLLAVFAVQHSVMARPGFKRLWTRLVPEPIERSTYVMISNLLMILMFMFWIPMPGIVWHVQTQVWRCTIWTLALAGWILVPFASLLINHFDLFGTRQVWLHWKRKPYTHLPFRTPVLYKLVRHPLYVGWLTGFWATPTMTQGHLLFAAALTGYILIAIRFEERDLRQLHGEVYETWRQRTGMLLPRPTGHRAGTTTAAPIPTAGILAFEENS